VCHRFADWCQQRGLDRFRESHDRGAGALVTAGDGGDEVLGGGPPDGFDGVGGFELADHAQDEGIERGLQRLGLCDGVHQFVASAGRPYGLGEVADLFADPCQRSRDTVGTRGAGWVDRLAGHE